MIGHGPQETPRQSPSQMADARPSACTLRLVLRKGATDSRAKSPKDLKMEPEAGCEAQGKLFEDEFTTLTPPPAVLTDKAIDCRLRRMFKPRADGTYPVDEHWRLDAERDRTSLFEKVGYDPDRVSQNSHE